MVILNGKVKAKAIGKKIPGFAFGTAIFIAAGTAMYDALAAKTAKINLFPISCVIKPLKSAIMLPLNKGIKNAKVAVNQPFLKNSLSFFPLVIPISKRKIAKNPLKISVVKGLIPWACLSFATMPIIKLPKISNTLPLVNECVITLPIFITCSFF